MAIQILRGPETLDPSTSDVVLQDGQPFYSKYNKQLIIGDGSSPLKDLKGVNKLNLVVEPGNVAQTISTFPDDGDTITREDDGTITSTGANLNDNAYGANIGRYLYSYGPYSIMGGYDSINGGGRNLVLGDKLTVGRTPDFTKLTTAGKTTYEANGGWTREIAVYGLNSDGMSGRKGNKDMACWEPNKWGYNAIFGRQNVVETHESLIAGASHIVKSGVSGGSNRGLLVTGYNNTVYTSEGSSIGSNNYIAGTSANCHAIGAYLDINRNKSLDDTRSLIAVGRANVDRNGTVFEVGAGTVVFPEGSTSVSDAIITRRNAFEVYYDGTIKSYDTSGNVIEYYSKSETDNKITNIVNNLTKSDVGLSNVDNTSDATKKANFTGSITSGNTGFVRGSDVYTELSKKANKATTLSGYGITDAYTKSEVNTELAKKADSTDFSLSHDFLTIADGKLAFKVDAQTFTVNNSFTVSKPYYNPVDVAFWKLIVPNGSLTIKSISGTSIGSTVILKNSENQEFSGTVTGYNGNIPELRYTCKIQ